MYKIQVEYTTGSSFETHNETSILEPEWKDLEILKENMKRISGHYQMYNKEGQWGAAKFDDLLEAYGGEVWFRKDCSKPSGIDPEYLALYSVMLIDDDRKSFVYGTSTWCGFFEHLNSIEAIVDLPKIDVEFSL